SCQETVRADIRLPGIIGNRMVLQRDIPLPIWGWAEPGEVVRVTFSGTTVSGMADAAGKWRITLPPQTAGGGPQEMTLAGQNTIKLTEILVGEVWIGS